MMRFGLGPGRNRKKALGFRSPSELLSLVLMFFFFFVSVLPSRFKCKASFGGPGNPSMDQKQSRSVKRTLD